MLIFALPPTLQKSLRGQPSTFRSSSFHSFSSSLAGFCRFSWASLARHEVPMITGSPGLGTCAKLGGCGLVGKLCMKIHSCKNVHNAVGPRGGSLLIASGKVPPLPMWIFALPPTLQKSMAIVTRKSSNFFSTIWHFYSVKVAKNLSR